MVLVNFFIPSVFVDENETWKIIIACTILITLLLSDIGVKEYFLLLCLSVDVHSRFFYTPLCFLHRIGSCRLLPGPWELGSDESARAVGCGERYPSGPIFVVQETENFKKIDRFSWQPLNSTDEGAVFTTFHFLCYLQ
jgi:hypothetical protein